MTPTRAAQRYENYIVFLAPLINSVAGIAIDLFAPSLPAIGREFAVTPTAMQNTLTVTLVFYALGQLCFGVMTDCVGRRPAIRLGLALFIGGSVLAAGAPSYEALIAARGLQGFAIGACQVVSRALLVDNVRGPRFRVAVVYLSLAFGLGPVISPYFGGLIQAHAGWRWNFAVYVGYGVLVLGATYAGLRESLRPAARRSIGRSVAGWWEILRDGHFLAAVVLLGASFASFLMWNVIGPYIVERHFGLASSAFGTSALAVGLGYLTGTTVNRTLLSLLGGRRLMSAGLVLHALGVGVVALGSDAMRLAPLLLGIVLIAFAQGFLFSNALATTLSRHPERAGAAASLQGCLMLSIGAAVTAAVSAIDLPSNAAVAAVFGALWSVAAAAALALARTGPAS